MKKYLLVFVTLALFLFIWSCNQDAPMTSQQSDDSFLTKEAPEIMWTANAPAWDVVGLQPNRCADPCSFVDLCPDDPDVFIEIPKTMVTLGRNIQSPMVGDLHNPNPDAIRMMMRCRINHEGNGEGDGLIRFKAIMGGLKGIFEGKFEADFNHEMCSGRFIAFGVSGDFTDRYIRGRFVEQEHAGGLRALTFQGYMYYTYPGDEPAL